MGTEMGLRIVQRMDYAQCSNEEYDLGGEDRYDDR
jgi:hypothetical protein